MACRSISVMLGDIGGALGLKVLLRWRYQCFEPKICQVSGVVYNEK
jgi:hypothetical protein